MTQLERLATALAHRYRVERELGAGGMATVYLAEDLKHRRRVAVKVLRPELAAALGPARFLREIEIAAGLHHPHILPLYDSGEADGFLYYVMPYEEGQSLRERLDRGGGVPMVEAVRVLRDVVDALAHAHAHGVIHRDIKPENILLAGQHAMVTDFGVAKAVSEATGAHQLTTAGVAVGTPLYMAPEQAAADPHVDQRADLYAVGVVAYELLTGRTPFTGMTPQQVLAAHISQKPEPVSLQREGVPPPLEALVMRCLEKNRADRWQTADELGRALDALLTQSAGVASGFADRGGSRAAKRYAAIGGLAAILVLVGFATAWFFKVGRPGTVIGSGQLAEHDLVLVAEFENRTADSSLAATVTDAVRVELQQSRAVRTMTQAAMWAGMQRMGLQPGALLPVSRVRELAEREQAKVFVTGDIGRLAGGYQLTARVTATATGAEVLTVRVTAADDAHLIEGVSELGRKLRRGIGESLRSVQAAPPLARVTTASLPALRAFMAGKRASYRGQIPRGILLFKEAVTLDSTFAWAWFGMAVAYLNDAKYRPGSEALERAYQLRERLPEDERLQISAVYHSSRREDALAEATYLRLLELDSANAITWANYSDVLLRSQRWSEAEAAARRGIEADSEAGLATYWNAIEAQLILQRFAAAESTVAAGVRRVPGWAPYLVYRTQIARHQFDRVQGYLESLKPPLPWPLCRLHLYRGRLSAWRRCRPTLASLEWSPYLALAEFRLDGDTARVRGVVDRVVRLWADSSDATNVANAIALLAEVGRVSEARRLLQAWRDRRDDNDPFRANENYAAAAIAAAEGHWDSAAQGFLAWNRSGHLGAVYLHNQGLVEAAGALDRAGNPDSAVALYERALALPSMVGDTYEAGWYPLVLKRLGELHQSLGHREQAIDYYQQFIELWKGADPVLQPQVRAVRDRLARLAGEQPTSDGA